MQGQRSRAKRHLGIEAENELFQAHGHDSNEYVHYYMQKRFNATKKAGICKFCKHTSVYVELRQDRSGDEGMTAHALCTNAKCRKRWVVY